MRYEQTPIYRYHELSKAAQENVKQWLNQDYSWGGEAIASIKALAEQFGGTMSNWSIAWDDCCYSSAKFDMPEMERQGIEELLNQLGEYNLETLNGLGDCKLTGYCADEDAIDGFRAAFIAGESDLGQLMESAFRSWLKAAQSDYAAQFEDEVVAETCEANEYEFYEDGSIA